VYANSTSGHTGELIQVLRNSSIKLLMNNDGTVVFTDSVKADVLNAGYTSSLKGYFYESTDDQNGSGKPSSVLGLAGNSNSVGGGASLDFSMVWTGNANYQQDNWNEGWTVGRVAGVYDSQILDGGALAFYTNSGGSGASASGAAVASLTQKMKIRPNGNVGIGPNLNALTKLHIEDTSADCELRVVTGGGNDAILNLVAPEASGAQSQILFSDSVNAVGSIIYTHNSGGTDIMDFRTAGALRATLRYDQLDLNVTKFMPSPYTIDMVKNVSFTHNVAHQKIDFTFPSHWGTFDVTITGSYSNQNMAGRLVRRFNTGLNANNAIYLNQSHTIYEEGVTADNFAITPIVWDSTLSLYKFTLVHRVSSGNGVNIRIEGTSVSTTDRNHIRDMGVSAVYTTDQTVHTKDVVTTPSIPSFSAGTNLVGRDFTTSSSGVIQFNTISHNEGGNFTGSTGRFTAPVAGNYTFSFSGNCMDLNGTNVKWANLRVNNAGTTRILYSSNQSGWQLISGTWHVALAKGDYVHVLSNGFTRWDSSDWTRFSGHLIA
jgi:hypothetical protein